MCVLTRYIHRNEFKKIIVMENENYYVEFTGEFYQSVFPKNESDKSQLHTTKQDAIDYIVQESGVYPTIL
jgi:hypothetical protein